MTYHLSSECGGGSAEVYRQRPFSPENRKRTRPLTQAAATAKQLQMAEFSMSKGDAKTAGGLVEQLLAREPENIGVLRLQTKLLMVESKKLEAANALEETLHVYYRKYPEAAPPLGLIHERSEALKDLKPEIVQRERASHSVTPANFLSNGL